MLRNNYILLGIGLVSAGVAFGLTAYLLLNSTPLTALGVSTAILGLVCIALGGTRPRISPEVASIFLETGLENISALLEELNLRSKAVYLPSSMTQGQPQALIPLRSNPSRPQIRGVLPKRLIVKYGPNPEEIGLLCTTPGSASIRMLESKLDGSSEKLEAALASVLVAMIDAADAVRVMGLSDSRVVIEVSNPHMEMEYEKTWLYDCLGSPIASIVASVAAEALDKPIIIDHEEYKKGKNVVELEVQ